MTPEYVRGLFDYDVATGDLLWRRCDGRRAKLGHPAGWVTAGRYRTTRHAGRVYYNHRLVWLWHGKELPGIIDHINGDKTDNRIENLRAATPSQNVCNTKLKSTNTSGVKGVNWVKRLKTWQVRLNIENRVMHFGHFKDFDLAELVAVEARNKYHGAFARHR